MYALAPMSASLGPRPSHAKPAVYALLLVTVLWGLTFVWMKQAVSASESALGSAKHLGSCWFIALRFGLAAVFMLPVRACWRGWSPAVWRGAFALGAILFAGFLLQMYGLENVSPAVSAFLTSLYVIFTALLVLGLTRRPPTIWLVVGVALATLGGAYISGPPHLTFGRGEWLTVGCAIAFAVHILLTDRVTKRLDALPITLLSFVVVVCAAALTLGIELSRLDDRASTLEELRELTLRRDFFVPLVCSSLFATSLALTLMNLFQKRLDPIRAAILYALEPVWASLFAWAWGWGQVDGWLLLGGSALLLGNLVAEIGPLLRSRRALPHASAE